MRDYMSMTARAIATKPCITAASRLRNVSLLCLGALAVSPVLCRAGQTAVPISVPSAVDASITTQTRVVPGCVLRVIVEGEQTISGEYEVDATGAIHFRLSDDEGRHREEWSLAVEQKTAGEVRDLVTVSLKKYLRTPVVHIAILQMPRLHIEMSGSGCKPGPLVMPLSARLSDVLTACKPNADMEHILILRRPSAPALAGAVVPVVVDTKPQPVTLPPSTLPPLVGQNTMPDADGLHPRTLTVNFLAFQQGESADDPPLQDGDRVFIQARPEGQPTVALRTVRVVGEVGREADLPLTPDMTVKDALARVGGVKAAADPNKIRLHRGESGRDFDLKLPGIQSNDPFNNIKLVAGDYIMVGKTDLSMRWAIDGEVAYHDVYPFNPAEHITVTSAIARAGGLTKSADRRKGVLRKGYLIDPTHARDITFDYEAILKKTQKDWTLDPGDVVVVLTRRKRPTIWQQLLPIALRFLPLPI